MPDRTYAVFLYPQALEALGPIVTPYLSESPGGPYLAAAEVDSSGALFEVTLIGKDGEGRPVEVDLMVPSGMIKLVISIRRDGDFGFGPHVGDVVPTPPPTPPPSTAAPGAAAT
jgi:hypothetical protein